MDNGAKSLVLLLDQPRSMGMGCTEEREQKSSEGKQGVDGCVALHLLFIFSLFLWLSMAIWHLHFNPFAEPVVPVDRVMPAEPYPRRGEL